MRPARRISVTKRRRRAFEVAARSRNGARILDQSSEGEKCNNEGGKRAPCAVIATFASHLLHRIYDHVGAEPVWPWRRTDSSQIISETEPYHPEKFVTNT